ncbi:phosphotyrosine protein phosphatase [Kiloniella spongiae]|uniref:protein-tyrosine-phosphatase n=1 Tax=Kiloniella spongiae TaxID=1489064 RepID=A0A0H2MEC9_9PROT|nr:low molecular weight protein-tyrosine-phosphatase [Kiloniella spongiae]KLN60723.1 phosphotyrosine protein phosphatase [Kiloniella spongiae]
MEKYKVLFVCTGNICRSPAADGILRHKLQESGLSAFITTDSVGTHSYHIGEPPTTTGLKLAAKRGYDYSDLRARQISAKDFETFDMILAMDFGHREIACRKCHPKHQNKISMFLDHSPLEDKEVKDPYYGGPQDYEEMLDVIETGVSNLVKHLKAQIKDR